MKNVFSVESLNDLHLAQISTYLKLSNCKLGLLMNFNTAFWNLPLFQKNHVNLCSKFLRICSAYT